MVMDKPLPPSRDYGAPRLERADVLLNGRDAAFGQGRRLCALGARIFVRSQG